MGRAVLDTPCDAFWNSAAPVSRWLTFLPPQSDRGPMALPDDPAPFTVTCHAGFDEDGVWLIDARLSWRDGPPPLGSSLLGRGRLAMMRAIAKAGLQGRSLGARKVQVHMEGHEVGEMKMLALAVPEPEGDPEA